MKPQEHCSIPTIAGLVAAAKSVRIKESESTLTDVMGISGICSVFPEFYPVANRLQTVLTLGHHIDHINDEGPDTQLKQDGPTNIASFNRLYSQFLADTSDDQALIANIVCFLSQAAVIEKESHTWISPSFEQIQSYRELVNAVWTRMMISYGYGILNGQTDPAGNMENANLSYDELLALHSSYMEGKEHNSVPGGEKNFALYKWTMAIQSEFDAFGFKHKHDFNLPTLRAAKTSYADQAVDSGVSPVAMKMSALAIQALLNIKHVFSSDINMSNGKLQPDLA